MNVQNNMDLLYNRNASIFKRFLIYERLPLLKVLLYDVLKTAVFFLQGQAN